MKFRGNWSRAYYPTVARGKQTDRNKLRDVDLTNCWIIAYRLAVDLVAANRNFSIISRGQAINSARITIEQLCECWFYAVAQRIWFLSSDWMKNVEYLQLNDARQKWEITKMPNAEIVVRQQRIALCRQFVFEHFSFSCCFRSFSVSVSLPFGSASCLPHF